jgi:hypothetical protein
MNEPTPAATPVDPTITPYKDRSTGLTVFGSLTILLGCLAFLLILVMMAGMLAAARATNAQSPHSPLPLTAMLPAIMVYGVVGVSLVWLGIGSILARRWARALLLIFSWGWLFMGLFAVIGMSFFVPKFIASASGAPATHHGLPSSTIIGVMVFMFLFLGVFFIIVPAVWIFFYNSRHVKATCESRNPLTAWTDACPLPVLALCLWLCFTVPMMLLMPVMGHGVMPFFGMFLSGAAGTVFCLVLAVVWAYAAWLLYKMDVRGWWLILVAMLVFMMSSVLTYAQHDMTEMYQRMGYPQSQIDMMRKSGLLTGNRMNWFMILSMVPFLGYLVFVKKYFRRET